MYLWVDDKKIIVSDFKKKEYHNIIIITWHIKEGQFSII